VRDGRPACIGFVVCIAAPATGHGTHAAARKITMATKAQQFRYEAERNHPKRAPTAPRAPKRRSGPDAGAQNLTRRGARSPSAATEESLSGRRSRKASRPANLHGKNSTVLEYASRIKSQSPQVRHRQR
jgi:hypothetical protein